MNKKEIENVCRFLNFKTLTDRLQDDIHNYLILYGTKDLETILNRVFKVADIKKIKIELIKKHSISDKRIIVMGKVREEATNAKTTSN